MRGSDIKRRYASKRHYTKRYDIQWFDIFSHRLLFILRADVVKRYYAVKRHCITKCDVFAYRLLFILRTDVKRRCAIKRHHTTKCDVFSYRLLSISHSDVEKWYCKVEGCAMCFVPTKEPTKGAKIWCLFIQAPFNIAQWCKDVILQSDTKRRYANTKKL